MHVHLNVIVNHIIGCMCSVLALKRLSAAYKYSEQASVPTLLEALEGSEEEKFNSILTTCTHSYTVCIYNIHNNNSSLSARQIFIAYSKKNRRGKSGSKRHDDACRNVTMMRAVTSRKRHTLLISSS